MDLSRQVGIIPPDVLDAAAVTMIGVGGIGSPLALTLAKMGVPRLKFFDDDTVESHNIPNQLFRLSDIGRPKVESCKEVIEDFTGAQVEAVNALFDGSQKLEGVVISAVDGMTVRKMIWEKVRYNIHVPLYIEGRMAKEFLRIYTLNPTDPEAVALYEATLYSDEEAQQGPCTEKSIIYTVMVSAGLMAGQVKKWLVGEPNSFEILMDMKTLTLMVE